MVVYGAVPAKQFRFALPSVPGAEIWGPGELDYWDETKINSRSQRTEVNPFTQQPVIIIDEAVFQYELLHTYLTHPDSGWNLEDVNGQAYETDTPTINKVFSRKDTRSDRRKLIEALAAEFFPEYVQKQKQAEDAAKAAAGQGADDDQGNSAPAEPGGNGAETSQPGTPPSLTPIRSPIQPTPSPSTIGSTTTPMEG